MENSRVEEGEDPRSGLRLGVGSRSNRVDGKPQLAIHAGELVCRTAVIEWIRTEIVGGNCSPRIRGWFRM